MGRLPGLKRYVTVALQILGVAVAYYLSARLGLLVGLVRGQVSPWWPATGIGVVALLVVGVRVWPGILVAQFVVELMTVPAIHALPSAVGTTLSCLVAYVLLRRVGFRVELDRLKDAFALVFLAAFAAMLISATAGAGERVLSGLVPASYFWAMWSTWWTGDAMGVLLFAPLLLVLRRLRWPLDVDKYRLLEFALLLVGSFVVVLAGTQIIGAVLFLAFPFLGWAALRFQLAGAAPVALLTSLAAVYAAVQGYGPFAGRDLLTIMITLQLFNGAVALSALLLAATITERDRGRVEIEQTAIRLGEVVNHLDRSKTTPRVEPRQFGEDSPKDDGP
ncbi:MASE1 domain-containing protein [Actinopolymorpha sp. B11F2]|uniref:MASE1 domain-containing protein n=1 Tax=Actinopolymorpha sp. B11F2 TaxID=3160862 RepID=UPI0032E38D87